MVSSIQSDNVAIARLRVQMIKAASLLEMEDSVAVEEPLEIRLSYCAGGRRIEQGISVTMRTPGHDPELAAGFLFTEGIISEAAAIINIEQGPFNEAGVSAVPNSIRVVLHEGVSLDLGRLQRHFYTSSSCGVCGKSSIESLRTVCPVPVSKEEAEPVDPELIYSLPALLRERQELFDSTGGLHASALFDKKGQLISLREDIGRHNALDKVIGHALQEGRIPLAADILLLSGRACFELIQKAAMAGIRMVIAVGPPSSLAIELAEEQGMTLVGFLRDQRFNIYSGAHRIRI